MEKIKLAEDDLNWRQSSGKAEEFSTGEASSAFGNADGSGDGIGLPKLSADLEEDLPSPEKLPQDEPIPSPSGGSSAGSVGLPKLSAEDSEAGSEESNEGVPSGGGKNLSGSGAAPALVIPKIPKQKGKNAASGRPAAAVPKIQAPRRAENTIAALPDDDGGNGAGRSGRGGVSDGENTFPETARVPESGSVVGAYELRGPAVPAGSFVLFQAYHANLDTCRTLEFLNGGDAGSIRDFLTRARGAAAADAPNLRSIIEVGENRESGYFYTVTENVAPLNLRGISGYGHFSTAQTVRLLAAVADALCAIERCGLCHGALSPELVLFSEDYETLKIAGLELGEEFTLSAHSSAVYAAPERAEGRVADIRSDLYSAGVIFYEAVTGKLPPPGRRGYVGADPREASGNVAGPIALILMRLLSLEPSARYNTAAEFAAAVHAAEAECRSMGSDKIAPQPGAPTAMSAAPGYRPGRAAIRFSGGGVSLLTTAWKIVCGILIVWLLVLAGFRIADGLQQLPPDDSVAKAALEAATIEADNARAELENVKRRAALIAQIEEENRK